MQLQKNECSVLEKMFVFNKLKLSREKCFF